MKGQHSCNKMFKKIVMVLFIGLLALAYQNAYHPPPLICGSPDGLPITGPRVVLGDGRHLAYNEYGLSRIIAKYKIVFAHGFSSSRFAASVYHPELFEEFKIYMVTFDRPSYGESDPDPKQMIKSLTLDIEDLADKLELGSKFYVIGYSHIAGVALVAPVVNYWWSSFPSNLSIAAYKLQPLQDQWEVGVSHYAYVIQQGLAESILRDMKVGFGKWEFDTMEIENPFPNNEGSVHLWHGDDDGLVPMSLQRYIAKHLSYIHYHELPNVGHLLPNYDGRGIHLRVRTVGKKVTQNSDAMRSLDILNGGTSQRNHKKISYAFVATSSQPEEGTTPIAAHTSTKSVNGGTAPVTGEGSMKISNSMDLDSVLVVLSLSSNLLSILSYGTRRGRLYYLKENHQSQAHHTGISQAKKSVAWLWHRRLGHLSFSYLRKLKANLFLNVMDSDFKCETCELAKNKRISYVPSNNKTLVPFMTIHFDVWGPALILTPSGARYFVIFVDEWTRMIWVSLLKNKGEVNYAFKELHHIIKFEYKREIQILESDNSKEYINHEMQLFCKENSIR
nr:hypothetical protein [Tanacetum cinerariifolium]